MQKYGWSVKPGNKHLVDEKCFNGTLGKGHNNQAGEVNFNEI